MPTKAPSHRPPFRVRARHADDVYDRTTRAGNAALATARKIRSSEAWNRCRASVLMASPLCADPHGHHAREGRLEVATQVHHVKPLATHPHLAFDAENLMAICEGCHAILSASERSKS